MTARRCCNRKGIAAFVAVVTIGVAAVFLIREGGTSSRTEVASVAKPGIVTEPETPPARQPLTLQDALDADDPLAAPPRPPADQPIIVDEWPSKNMNAPLLELVGGKLAWELEVEAVVNGAGSPRDKAQRLFTKLKSLPADAYGRLVEEAVKQLPDSDFEAVALPYLLDPRVDGAAAIPLHADLLERPDAITLPALLAIARQPNHPLSQSAHETLSLLVGTDAGSDWGRWNRIIEETLAKPER